MYLFICGGHFAQEIIFNGLISCYEFASIEASPSDGLAGWSCGYHASLSLACVPCALATKE